jgi:hypothetical protein
MSLANAATTPEMMKYSRIAKVMSMMVKKALAPPSE